MIDLPERVLDRVCSEFPESEQPAVLRTLALCFNSGGQAHIGTILDLANGNAESIDSLVETAVNDYRNLYYDHRKDPGWHVEKLLKNLRFKKVFTDAEVTQVKDLHGGIDYEKTFKSTLGQIRAAKKRITLEQHNRILAIGGMLNYPTHSLDWLSNYLNDDDHKLFARNYKDPWWKFW